MSFFQIVCENTTYECWICRLKATNSKTRERKHARLSLDSDYNGKHFG